ncbi:MAG: GTPase ObgE [Lentisphaeria bacterium]|nr:GTPase ObgE [Lentisphaeria bacterium]
MFVDRVNIKIRGGDGGHGSISFRREKYIPKGGPDGGDGGNGGSVIFVATAGEQSLVDLYYMNHYEAKNGVPGMGKNRHGHNGADKVVNVPVGTVFYDLKTGEVVADLTEDGQEWVGAKGGSGGHGNRRFISSKNRAPRIAGEGYPGEERELRLELKTIADVGLVGYPNAGKSTFLSAVSDAHPKTAPYPFTTRHPNVGVVEFDDYTRMTIADIPGLIDGAHNNVGLGHDFLRHIERCRMLLYVLDTAGVDTRNPADDLDHLKKELELYLPGLTDKPSLVVANKMDLPESADHLAELKKRHPDVEIMEISALTHDHTHELIQRLRRIIQTA